MSTEDPPRPTAHGDGEKATEAQASAEDGGAKYGAARYDDARYGGEKQAGEKEAGEKEAGAKQAGAKQAEAKDADATKAAEKAGPEKSGAGWRRAALLFGLGLAVVALTTVAVLSFDEPLVRQTDPETDNAYVGGDTVPVAARVQGYLVALPIADNQPVRAGDALAQIETDDYQAQLDQAQAALQAARAQVDTLNAQLGELTAQIGQAQTQEASQRAGAVRTAPELVRQEKLINTDVGVRRTLEQAQADQRRTDAGVESAHAGLIVRTKQVDTLTAQRDEAVAAVAARQADVALAAINLGWTRVTAPVDGTLAARRVRVGDLLQPGTTITSLTPLDTVWVDANFTERQIPPIRVGQPAQLRVDAFPGQPLDGHVMGLSPLTGSQMTAVPPDNVTGNFTKVVQRVTVRIAIDWHGSPLIGRVRPGMSVTATVFTDRGS